MVGKIFWLNERKKEEERNDGEVEDIESWKESKLINQRKKRGKISRKIDPGYMSDHRCS